MDIPKAWHLERKMEQKSARMEQTWYETNQVLRFEG